MKTPLLALEGGLCITSAVGRWCEAQWTAKGQTDQRNFIILGAGSSSLKEPSARAMRETRNLLGGAQVLGSGHVCVAQTPAASPHGRQDSRWGTDRCLAWAPRMAGATALAAGRAVLQEQRVLASLPPASLLTNRPPHHLEARGSRQPRGRPQGWPFLGGGLGRDPGPWACASFLVLSVGVTALCSPRCRGD